MTVGELLEQLDEMDPNLEVFFCGGYWYEADTFYSTIDDVKHLDWPEERVLIGSWSTDGIRHT